MLHEWEEDSMLVKRIAAYTNLSSTVYELYRDIGLKLQLFPTPCIKRPVGVFLLEFREKFGPRSYSYNVRSMTDAR